MSTVTRSPASLAELQSAISTAAAIARIKAAHPAWSVREVRSGRGWTAKHRETRATVYADSPEALAVTLAEIDSRTRD